MRGPWRSASSASASTELVFHPLFVAPFILMLLCQKRVRLAAFYMAGYGVALAACSLYPVWLAWLQTPGAELATPSAPCWWTAGRMERARVDTAMAWPSD